MKNVYFSLGKVRSYWLITMVRNNAPCASFSIVFVPCGPPDRSNLRSVKQRQKPMNGCLFLSQLLCKSSQIVWWGLDSIIFNSFFLRNCCKCYKSLKRFFFFPSFQFGHMNWARNLKINVVSILTVTGGLFVWKFFWGKFHILGIPDNNNSCYHPENYGFSVKLKMEYE